MRAAPGVLRRGVDVNPPQSYMGAVPPTIGATVQGGVRPLVHNEQSLPPSTHLQLPGRWVTSAYGPLYQAAIEKAARLRAELEKRRLQSRIEALEQHVQRQVLGELAQREIDVRANAKRLRQVSPDVSRGKKKKNKSARRRARQAKAKAEGLETKTKVKEAKEGLPSSPSGRVKDVPCSLVENSPHSHKVEGGGDGGESQEAPRARTTTYGQEEKGDGDARMHSTHPTPTLVNDYSYLYGDEMEKAVVTEVDYIGEGHIDPRYERDHEVTRPLSDEIVVKTMHIPNIEVPPTPYVDEDALVANEAWEAFLREVQDMVDPSAQSIWVTVDRFD